jgi:hypothetical protein
MRQSLYYRVAKRKKKTEKNGEETNLNALHLYNLPVEVILSLFGSFKCIKVLSSKRALILVYDCINLKTDHLLEQRTST